MQVIDQKVQYFPLERPDSDMPNFVRLGLYMEFDDGHRITSPNGQTYVGKGTRARFSFKHGTWSVEPPQRAALTRMGYVFDRHGQPTWEQPKKTSGLSVDAFKREYNHAFVRTCFNHMAMV